MNEFISPQSTTSKCRLKPLTVCALILFAVIALTGWWIYSAERERETESRLTGELKDNGIGAKSESKPPAWLPVFRDSAHLDRIIGVDCVSRPISDELLQGIGDLPDLEWLRVREAQLTDKQLSYLTRSRLSAISLNSNPEITDDGLLYLHALPLKKLWLAHTRLKGTGLAHIQADSLEYLDLEGTEIDDHALEIIGRMSNLETLMLSSPKITNDGLKFLLGMKSLRHLSVFGDQLSDEGITPLADLPALESLFVGGNGISQGVNERLHKLKPELITSNGRSLKLRQPQNQ